VDYLLGPLGLSPPEARQLVLAAPELLAEKDFDLDRKWRFIQVDRSVPKGVNTDRASEGRVFADLILLGIIVCVQGTMNAGKEQVLACPRLMAASLMQVRSCADK
jgi:hypothetical protein